MGFTRITVVTLIALFSIPEFTYGVNILFFWGYSGYSHRITVWPLVEKLADKGHNVTFLSPHFPKKPTKHPNITDVTKDIFKKVGMNYHPADIRINQGMKATDDLWYGYCDSGIESSKLLLEDEELIGWANNASFDLVVVNALFNDVAYGFAWKWNAPTIIYSPTSLFMWWGEAYGIPEENHPEFHFHLPAKMSFFEEVWNTFTPLLWHAYRIYYFLPKIEAILRPALGVYDMPSLLEMDQRNALIFTNTHFSEEVSRSLPPWVVSVGGQHCTDETKPLSKDLQTFVDKWDGIIYFSFGTYMKLPLLPDHLKAAIFGAIKKFPTTGFILRWSGGEIPVDLPENVYASEWLAQQDILAHPKARAFITHGGLLSTQESIFHGVPMIVFPIFAEQDYNAMRIDSNERGIMMEIGELTEEKFESAIREILTNKKYKENVEHTSRIFRDRPQKSVDNAVWWVEYVLRHKNTSFLRPVGVTRTWYQRRMLHVWGFVAAVGLVTLITLFVVVRVSVSFVLKSLGGKSNRKVKSQ